VENQAQTGRGATPAVNIVNNKEGRPLEYYSTLYANLEPEDVARRCGVKLCAGFYEIQYMSGTYKISYPDFAVEPNVSNAEKILLLRFLIEGKVISPSGNFITFREAPKAAIYNANFQGRCIKRLAFGFGSKLERWSEIMHALGAVEVSKFGDAAFDWEIIPSLTVRFIIWSGDDEDGFPPSSQILFSDNFPQAFSGEDLAVIGDITINRMKAQN